jgi:hypothetical protein
MKQRTGGSGSRSKRRTGGRKYTNWDRKGKNRTDKRVKKRDTNDKTRYQSGKNQTNKKNKLRGL